MSVNVVRMALSPNAGLKLISNGMIDQMQLSQNGAKPECGIETGPIRPEEVMHHRSEWR